MVSDRAYRPHLMLTVPLQCVDLLLKRTLVSPLFVRILLPISVGHSGGVHITGYSRLDLNFIVLFYERTRQAKEPGGPKSLMANIGIRRAAR